MTVLVKAPAKVNLYLDVLGKDPHENYHAISSVMMIADSLVDEIRIEPLDAPGKEFYVEMIIDPKSKYSTPEGGENACFKVATLLVEEAKKAHLDHKITPIRITLTKNIPNKAGLGGGSSDVAATLKALNNLWELNFSLNKLIHIATQISMDAAFFVMGCRFAYVSGFGEHIEPIESSLKLDVRIVETGVEVDTTWAYANLDLEECGRNENRANDVIDGLEKNQKEQVLSGLHNDFEYLIFKTHPNIKQQIEAKRFDGIPALLSGSGGCFFYSSITTC